MPRTGITAYDLLVSCPSDVETFLDIIKSCVDNFNIRYGKSKNIHIDVNHWSTDSYPQSGGKPQELLNKQFIRKCDAAVAVFWTRFGTPTDKYGSGTEEEIEEMIAAKKQVFMYFLDSPICPSKIDMEQYEKVKAFRDKYKYNEGLCKVVKDEQDFQKKFSDNLEMYFSNIKLGENDGITKKARPVLKIYDAKSLSDNKYNLNYPNLCNSKFVVDKRREEILLKIKNLQSSCLPKRTPVINDLSNQDSTSNDTNVSEIINNMYIKKLRESTNALTGILINAEICSKWKDVVKTFALNNGIELCEDFWNLGDLKESAQAIILPYGNEGDTLEGTNDEKKRYNMLEELYLDVESYNDYITYFSTLDKYNYAKLVVSNIGNSVDEDIDVKLIIPKGYILKLNNFLVPGINIIKELLEMKFFECKFTIEENENIEKYRYYPVQIPHYNPIHPLYIISASQEYNENKKKYMDLLKCIFCYKLFENQDNDILMFHIDYLKHNTKMAFPSVLIFKNVPEYIKYEITSKHVEEIQKGEIKFVKNRE